MTGYKKLVVSRRERESALVTSYYFKAPDDGPLADDFMAGQYLSVRIPKGMDGMVGVDHAIVRNFSLSGGPNQGEYRVSIKREEADETRPQGLVSNWFYDHVHEGSTVEVSTFVGKELGRMTKL